MTATITEKPALALRVGDILVSEYIVDRRVIRIGPLENGLVSFYYEAEGRTYGILVNADHRFRVKT